MKVVSHLSPFFSFLSEKMVNGLFGMSHMIKICITPFECIIVSVTHLYVIMPCLLKEMERFVHT